MRIFMDRWSDSKKNKHDEQQFDVLCCLLCQMNRLELFYS